MSRTIRAATKRKTGRYILIELITRNAGQSQDERGPYFPRPSSAGACIRNLVGHAMGIPAEPLPDRALLVFEDGNWHEELIKDHVRKTAYELVEWKGKKQRIAIAEIGDRVMDGEIDALITDPLGVTRLLSIKSMNHFGFERLPDKEKGWDHLNDWPEASKVHYSLNRACRQDNLYLHGLKQAGFPEINEVLIVIKNKNTATLTEFLIAYNEEQAKADIEIFREVDRYATEKKLPPRPYTLDDWQCGYCPRETWCWAGYIDEVKALSEDVALSEEIETAARYYKELGAQEGEIGKQRDEIKAKLKAALFAAGGKTGKAGEYILSYSVGTRQTINEKLVPAEAIGQVLSERFTVSKVKPKKEKEKKK